MKILNSVGCNLKKHRRAQNLTEEKLAQMVSVLGWDIDRSGIGKIEGHWKTVSDTNILILSTVLDVNLSLLLTPLILTTSQVRILNSLRIQTPSRKRRWY